jgi:hypothetical protein
VCHPPAVGLPNTSTVTREAHPGVISVTVLPWILVGFCVCNRVVDLEVCVELVARFDAPRVEKQTFDGNASRHRSEALVDATHFATDHELDH